MKTKSMPLWLLTSLLGLSVSGADSAAAPAFAFFTCERSTCVVDTATDSISGTLPYGGWINVTSPDGAHLYATTENNGEANANSVIVMNYATNTVENTIPTSGISPFGMAINQDGSRLFVVHYQSGNMAVIDTKTNIVVAQPWVGRAVTVSLSPDGTRAFVPQASSTLCHIIDLSDYAVHDILCSLDQHAAVWSTDSNRIFVGGAGGSVSVYDASIPTYPLITSFHTGLQDIWTLLVSPDGTRLYASGDKISITDITKEEYPLISTIVPPTDIVYAPDSRPIYNYMTLTPDGSKLYVPDYANNRVDVFNTSDFTISSYISITAPGGVGSILPPPQGTVFDSVTNALDATGIQIQAPSLNSVRSAAMTTRTSAPSKRKIVLKSTFTLNSTKSNGMSPTVEQFRLMIGSLNVTLPSGCFKYRRSSKNYVCKKNIDGISYSLNLRKSKTNNSYTLQVIAKGPTLPKSISKPVAISFSIGNDAGFQILN